jgi:hypothetical protein
MRPSQLFNELLIDVDRWIKKDTETSNKDETDDETTLMMTTTQKT